MAIIERAKPVFVPCPGDPAQEAGGWYVVGIGTPWGIWLQADPAGGGGGSERVGHVRMAAAIPGPDWLAL